MKQICLIMAIVISATAAQAEYMASASGRGVWIVDTETGTVKYCFVRDYKVICIFSDAEDWVGQ